MWLDEDLGCFQLKQGVISNRAIPKSVFDVRRGWTWFRLSYVLLKEPTGISSYNVTDEQMVHF